MTSNAAAGTLLWERQRLRLRRLQWMTHARREIYGDLIAIFHIPNPTGLAAADYVGLAELAHNYDGAVASRRQRLTATIATAINTQPAHQAPTVAPSQSAADSASMGIPHVTAGAGAVDGHWDAIAKLNNLEEAR